MSSCRAMSSWLLQPPAGSPGRIRRCPQRAELAHAEPAPVAIGAVGGCRQIPAIDRRAAGGVGDQGAIAEELREQLTLRRLARSRSTAPLYSNNGSSELAALDVNADLCPIRLGKVKGRT